MDGRRLRRKTTSGLCNRLLCCPQRAERRDGGDVGMFAHVLVFRLVVNRAALYGEGRRLVNATLLRRWSGSVGVFPTVVSWCRDVRAWRLMEVCCVVLILERCGGKEKRLTVKDNCAFPRPKKIFSDSLPWASRSPASPPSRSAAAPSAIRGSKRRRGR